MLTEVGFTSVICVVQPPPSAKCANTAGPDDGERARLTTGSVVSRNSPRSLVAPRNAVTLTGLLAVKLKDPTNEVGPINGLSSRNAATCPFAGIVVVLVTFSLPSASVK